MSIVTLSPLRLARILQIIRPKPRTTGLHTPCRYNSSQKPQGKQPAGNSLRKRLAEPVTRFLTWYTHHQKQRPLTTQLCSTPLIYCIGDLSAQLLSGEPYDAHRSLRSAIIGLVTSLPSYKWFLFLGRQFNYPGGSSAAIRSTGAKVVVNQLVYTPLFNVYFFAFHALLAGEGVAGAVDRVCETVPESIPRSFLYWPVVTAVNFTYAPAHSRSVATGVFAVFWQSYLSWLNSRVERGVKREGGEAKGVILNDLDVLW
ncbi:hypothetical protein BJX62DRAFT_232570 [Aspergillus germanicus]